MRLSAREQHLKELLVRGLSGEAAAYAAFLRELSAFLRAFLRGRLARVPDEVEDLVQETLLAVHNQRHTYDAAQPLTAWVHAIARYKLIDFLRRRAGREAMNDPLGDEDDLLATSDEEAREARRDMAVLLAKLPDRHRLPLRQLSPSPKHEPKQADRDRYPPSARRFPLLHSAFCLLPSAL